MTLRLPHALRAGETAWIEVKVGAIARGEEIEITTTAGRSLGACLPSTGASSGRRPVHRPVMSARPIGVVDTALAASRM